MKYIVQKLSGFAKFELDHKLTKDMLSDIMLALATDEKREFDYDVFENFCGIFEKALVEGTEPFKGDLENENYKAILQAFRDLQ
jgi:hypothetical protein